jgi:hypothetical protein
MPIIIHSEYQNMDWARWNIYPDQFVSESEKRGKNWIKSNMDYFANVAYSQFIKAKETFVRNYNLVKGIIGPKDFYIEDAPDDMRSFTETLLREVELPPHVKHYPILNPPLNTMVGELSRRPDQVRVKAMDEESKNEQLQYMTEVMQNYILENAMQQIRAKLALSGEQIEDEQLQQMTIEQVQEHLTDYTSTAEKWGNHVLEALKVELNLKEISEDCYRDLLISAREFAHIYETNNKLGIGVENLNPKNVWYLTLPDKKYIHKDAFAAGTVHVMELSEIIERFDLTKAEIDHLRKGIRELSLFSPRESNFENLTISGWDSIKYDTYSPYIVQQRLLIESELKENVDSLSDFLGLSSNVNTFGNKYVVVQAYWLSKKKVGNLTYVDESGEEFTTLVDENYRKIPGEISIEWNYVNQWYKGYKIGSDVYKVEPFKLLDGCPIIGVVHEIKNVNEAKSLVDLLKPFQVLYNICLNQLYQLLEKEIGNVYQGSIRHIPTPKDGDGQDALDIWEMEARKRGMVMIDDSPENLKSPSSFNMFKNVDLTRTQEIQSRYTLAQQLKVEAWELVGITKERTGGVAATQTATGTNAALSQSYAQTEPYFAQHEYVMNDLYQALLDAVQYVESKKPYSTISYVNTEGEQGFIRVNGEDISMRDLKVFATSRTRDVQEFQELRQLAQPMLQNGATPYEISILYSTNSVRQMRQVFKSLRDKMEAMQQQQMQMQQQQMENDKAMAEANLQFQMEQAEIDRQFEAQQNELDRINEREKALIAAAAKTGSPVAPDTSPILSEMDNRRMQQDIADRELELKRQQLQQKDREREDYIQLELRKLQMEKEKLRAQMQDKKADRALKRQQNKSKKRS